MPMLSYRKSDYRVLTATWKLEQFEQVGPDPRLHTRLVKTWTEDDFSRFEDERREVLGDGEKPNLFRVEYPDQIGVKFWPGMLPAPQEFLTVELSGPPGDRWISALVDIRDNSRHERTTPPVGAVLTPEAPT